MSEQHEAELAQRLAAVKERIRVACEQAGRDPAEVTLVGVSKTKPLADLQVAVAAGLNDLGENYVQEAVDKISQWQGPAPTWHFIGPIQSNKTRQIAEHFDWVHSVDRLKIARRLSEQRPEEKAPLKTLVQVNVSDDPAKAGVHVAEVADLIQAMSELPNMDVCGIMAIPALDLPESELRRQFLQLKSLSDTLTSENPDCHVISMGMSADFELAIACGATHVRVGSAIFGARSTAPN